ncbi:right-handed parallel beta-helix repeat-containing protein [Altererythrobacter aquiaggeris]|uniref:right-handed parallel beta-helix repeat-containing protein n=1 Tax=Aestuarierythrobacter aquiaggeris TaxID=1898396 RepID=UPI00301698FF
MVLGFAAIAAIPAIPAGASLAQSGASYTVVETGQTFARLQQAVDAIGSGTGSISIGSGVHRDCAVQTGGTVSYLASQPGKAVFDSVTCEGKAALVLRGSDATISGVIFQNMAVPDGNGSGIRLEKGNLTVVQSWFKDSQQGILTAHDGGARLVVDKSTFTRLGTCEFSGGCAHSIYAGEIAHVRVTRSRFEEGRGGHYLKSRAGRIDVASSSFDDTGGRETNYMIDLPDGATGQITNNWFVQGQSKENYSAFISVAPEDRANSSNGLLIAGNDARLAPGVQRSTIFVADWSGDSLAIDDNRLGSGLERFEKR